MLISCSFCKSKYLVNSADLKPSGRIVQCAKCKNKWYQELLANEKDQIEESSAFSEPPLSDKIKKTIYSLQYQIFLLHTSMNKK